MTETVVLAGRLEPGAPDWFSLPIEVPVGIGTLTVFYSYDKPPTPPGIPGNALDLAIFGPEGFRGYSGGARTGFTIGDASVTTPGYVAGPITPGTWQVLIPPYTVAPQGVSYHVEVTLTPGEPGSAVVPTYARSAAKGRPRTKSGWYRGDLHMHTVHSDGQWVPEQLANAARANGLDFIVSTEHNTNTAHAIWGQYADDNLLILSGEEVTTRTGHLVAAGLEPGTWLDWRFRSPDDAFPATVEEIHQHGGLAIAAHPHAPCLGCQWKFGYEHVDAVEVWNGPWTPDDEVSLQQWNSMLTAARRWVPAVGSSDSHTPDDPIGLPQTVVFADELSKDAVLAGVRAGRSYIAESQAISLEFTATTTDGQKAGIGEHLTAPSDTPVTVRLEVEGVDDTLVRLITDEGWVFQSPLPASGLVEWTTTPAVSRYVRAEVRKPGPQFFEPMAALTNPIFLANPIFLGA